MNGQAAVRLTPPTPFEQLRYAQSILRSEAQGILDLARQLPQAFSQVVEKLAQCGGHVLVSGIGKAGIVGKKIAATLASTGTPSYFLHPADALHGDLGSVRAGDVVLLLSHSGESEEIVRLLDSLAELEITTVAVTGNEKSTLAMRADLVLSLGPLEEACRLGLAPSTSTTVMLALGDALALVASQVRGFGRDDFARYHPGGSLGRKLSRVESVMRPLAQCRIAGAGLSVREVYVRVSRPGRRTGAVMLVDEGGRLTGLFTDSDLARLLESGRADALDQPMASVMTRSPRTLAIGTRLADAVDLMAEHKISEIPIVTDRGTPAGMIDITDVVGLQPDERQEAEEFPALLLPRQDD